MSSESIERFSIDDGYVPVKDVSYPSMEPDERGEYVRYSDHRRIVKELERLPCSTKTTVTLTYCSARRLAPIFPLSVKQYEHCERRLETLLSNVTLVLDMKGLGKNANGLNVKSGEGS